ncbi:hypothetical protein Tsubulata_015943 [Turnera subulata]|uniref:RBR-type E3 ubiquitin transferase n=1 Tax=Turnera subulata TaxID=218843 RepID=A0A9Q0G9T8_9ROSI|nr:hypothetical protein Tsubulata_015943 [Turnera subulata]
MDEREVSDDYSSDDDYMADYDDVIYEYSDDDYINDAHYVNVIDEVTETRKVLGYAVLSEADIKKLQEDAITEVSSLLSLSRGEAINLLRNHGWSVDKVQTEWFIDEDKVRRSCGLLDKESCLNAKLRDANVKEEAKEILCKLCSDETSSDNFASAACGHLFCKECLLKYVRASIDDGAGCLGLRCPEPKCKIALDQDMVELVCGDDGYREKYRRFLLRSYVEGKKWIKWCPAPGCEYAIMVFNDLGEEGFDAFCHCKYGFCWNCSEDSHWPVDCRTVARWAEKNSREAENTNWILANTKLCPNCKCPVERSSGTMCMRCRPPCSFVFCWLCLGEWKTHGRETGGLYKCNIYEQAKAKGIYNEEDTKREMAKSALDTYTHYYERWSSNGTYRDKAREYLKQMQADKMLDKLALLHHTTPRQLGFITDALSQIIECRRVLKWSYAYGYYIPDENIAKKNLFEHLQGQAEDSLERLHHCMEEEMKPFFEPDIAGSMEEEFQKVSAKLKELAPCAKTYFENLVKALENNLADVESCGEGRSNQSLQVVTNYTADKKEK